MFFLFFSWLAGRNSMFWFAINILTYLMRTHLHISGCHLLQQHWIWLILIFVYILIQVTNPIMRHDINTDKPFSEIILNWATTMNNCIYKYQTFISTDLDLVDCVYVCDKLDTLINVLFHTVSHAGGQEVHREWVECDIWQLIGDVGRTNRTASVCYQQLLTNIQ